MAIGAGVGLSNDALLVIMIIVNCRMNCFTRCTVQFWNINLVIELLNTVKRCEMKIILAPFSENCISNGKFKKLLKLW